MEINLQNYQVYFLDYAENRLSKEQLTQLDTFLASYPNLRQEMEEYQAITIRTEKIEFDNKRLLKKSGIFNENEGGYFTEQAVSYLEGLMNKKQCAEFEQSIKLDDEKIRAFELYKKVYIKSDKNIIFQNKNALKISVGRHWIYYASTAAASIVLILGIIFYERQVAFKLSTSKPEVAQKLQHVYYKPPLEHISNQNIYINKSKRGIVSNITAKKLSIQRARVIEKDTFSRIQYYSLLPLKSLQIQLLNPIELKIEHKSLSERFFFGNRLEARNNTIDNFIMEEVEKIIPIDNLTNEYYKMNTWYFIQAVVKGINKITGSDMTVNKIDNSGSKSKIVIESDLFAFSTNIKK